MTIEPKETILKHIQVHGITESTIICMEECSELVKECSKILRGSGEKARIAEEMADVEICLSMLKTMYCITDTYLSEWVAYKMLRLKRRLEEEGHDR